MNGPLNFADTLIICGAIETARAGGSLSDCPYTDARRSDIWAEAFKAYLDGQAAKAEPLRVAA